MFLIIMLFTAKPGKPEGSGDNWEGTEPGEGTTTVPPKPTGKGTATTTPGENTTTTTPEEGSTTSTQEVTTIVTTTAVPGMSFFHKQSIVIVPVVATIT